MFDHWFLLCFFDIRGVSFGGKGSTDYVVKGSHTEVPQELIDELSAICQVSYLVLFLSMAHYIIEEKKKKLKFVYLKVPFFACLLKLVLIQDSSWLPRVYG